MEVTTKKQNRRKIVIGVLIAVVVLVAAVIAFASSYLVNYAIGRSGDGGDREVALDVEAPTDGVEQLIAENRAVQKQANEEFLQQNPGQTVQITAADGLRLNGVYYPNAGSHLWVIALHGYRGSHTGVTNLAQHYHDAGYQVLTPDLRACGDSEGDYVGMGWLDRKDVLQWIDWVLAQDSEAEIVLHGVSMGAATTMMTAGEDTPEQVKVFVEDCGYTSVWDIFSSELKLRFGLPEFPILYTASATARAKAGYGFKEKSELEAVLQGDDAVVNVGVLAVRRKVTGAHELEPLAGLGIGQALFQLGVVNDLHAVGVQVILEVSAIGNAVHVGFGKQLVVQVDLSVHAVLAADPMDGAAHLAAIGGVAVAGF